MVSVGRPPGGVLVVVGLLCLLTGRDVSPRGVLLLLTRRS